LKAPDSDKANTVAVQINDPESPSNITGIGLYYMSTDYSLWVNITCDADKDELEITGSSKDGSNYAVYATHKSGCPTIQYSLIYKFLQNYSYLWGAVIIALGLIFCFAGNYLINGILFLTGAIISFGALSYVTFAILEHLDKSPTETVQWVIIGVCGVAGVLLGLLVKKIRPLGIGALAAWGGVVLGLLITTTFVVSNQYAKWGTIAACAFALGYTAFRVEKNCDYRCHKHDRIIYDSQRNLYVCWWVPKRELHFRRDQTRCHHLGLLPKKLLRLSWWNLGLCIGWRCGTS